MKYNLIAYLTVAVGVIVMLFQTVAERHMEMPAFFENDKNITTVIIDPGHGGDDGGATGVTGTLEKGINLSISRKLQAILEFCGEKTVMTRDGDESIHDEGNSVRGRKVSDIKNRVKLVSKAENPVLLSVHLNFFPQESCRGAQVFYSANNDASKNLAESVQEMLKAGMNDGNNRSAKKAEKSIYLLNHVECPAVLTECGFLSNYSEEALLVTEEYQTKLAMCIAAGYLQFISME